MPYVPLALPPGVIRPETIYNARGRWYDSSLVRWHDGVMQPWGGWALLSGCSSAAVGGAVRGMFAWRRNGGTAFAAFGTRTKLWAYSAGTLSDITPAGMTTGATDASGTFYARVEAHSWQMDAFGEDLVACSYTDGRIVLWDSSVGVGTPAAPLAGAPTGCKGVVVTPERFIVALAASGDGRLVAWADQESGTAWTPAVTNQAGDFTLPGQGSIMAGRRGRNETLIWTDMDLFAMRYIGSALVYSFQPLGAQCGAISRRSMVVVDGKAIWMGQRGFFMYDGFVREIPCEVGDYVFGRLNRAQASKVWAATRSDYNEVIFGYPAGSGNTECDSSVTYNWATNHFTLGGALLTRTDAIDRGFLEYPIASGAVGAIYEHESGTTFQEESGGSYVPYVESGPVELGEGDNVMLIRQYVPDEATLGQVNTRLYTRMYPSAAETTSGPYTNANPTDVLLTARQVRVRHTQVTAGWRVGTPRLEVVAGGLR